VFTEQVGNGLKNSYFCVTTVAINMKYLSIILKCNEKNSSLSEKVYLYNLVKKKFLSKIYFRFYESVVNYL
jgi:hypothetical protein